MKDGAVLYCRVSTDDQVGNNSLPIQLKECRRATTQLNCKVLREFVEEGESGAKLQRTEMMKMLSFCIKNKAKIRYVIVKDIDRFSRDTYVHLGLRTQFQEIGIELYSVNQPSIADGTIESQLSENIFSAFAQFERLKILERTKKGSMEVITRGGWTSKPPYGYRSHRRRDVKRLRRHVPRKTAARFAARSFTWQNDGVKNPAVRNLGDNNSIFEGVPFFNGEASGSVGQMRHLRQYNGGCLVTGHTIHYGLHKHKYQLFPLS